MFIFDNFKMCFQVMVVVYKIGVVIIFKMVSKNILKKYVIFRIS